MNKFFLVNRKRKIRIIQILLFVVSFAIIFKTYFDKDSLQSEKIISVSDKNKLKDAVSDNESDDIFYNIKYSGLDLSGNRYILESKEARTDKSSQEIVNMKYVSAVFYFKDNTTLYINSDYGIYNNKSLDMIFEKNVEANYEDSKLSGEKIIYYNSKKTLIVSENVKVNDIKGNIMADKLFFDLEKKTLDISSNKNKVNANINLE